MSVNLERYLKELYQRCQQRLCKYVGYKERLS